MYTGQTRTSHALSSGHLPSDSQTHELGLYLRGVIALSHPGSAKMNVITIALYRSICHSKGRRTVRLAFMSWRVPQRLYTPSEYSPNDSTGAAAMRTRLDKLGLQVERPSMIVPQNDAVRSVIVQLAPASQCWQVAPTTTRSLVLCGARAHSHIAVGYAHAALTHAV